jgi:hypothetical protein
MEKQTIMWTALPNGVTVVDGKPMLNLSVYTSFRLMSTAKGMMTLTSFPDLLDWGTKIKSGLTVKLEFGGGPTLPAKLKSEQIEPELWPLLFTAESPVKPYEYDDLSKRIIHSYPVKNVESFIKNQYSDVAIENPAEFPDGNQLMKRLEPIGLYHYGVEKAPAGAPAGKTMVLPGITRQGMVQDAVRFSPKVRATVERQSQLLLKTPSMTLKTPAAKAYQNILQELDTKRAVKDGSPDATKDFLQLSIFHTPQGTPTKAKGKAVISPIDRVKMAIPTVDVHEALSSLGDYPELMQRLGLVLDLQVPLDSTIPAASTLKVVPQLSASFTVNTVTAMPKTAYQLTASSFRATPKAGSTDLKNGLLNLGNTSAFDVVQLDVDGAALKLLNLAATLEQLERVPAPQEPIVVADASGKQGLAALGLANEIPKILKVAQRVSLPSLRSAGLSVVRVDRPQVVVAMIDSANAHNALLKNAEAKLPAAAPKGTTKTETVETILYADDLVRGYRIDVWSSDNSAWHSLCMRKGKFNFTRKAGTDRTFSEEAIVGMATTEAADGSSDDLKLGESLFRWDGWSLAAPRPGKTIGPDDTVQAITNKSNTPYGLEVGMKAEAKSLPKLRFGTRYRLRARAVDLAGNGLTLDQCAPMGFEGATAEKTYLRHEPVSSPAMLLRTQMKPGESLENITIRSNYDKSVDEYAQAHSLTNYIPERHLVAPKLPQQMIETHGRFDGLDPATSYSLITNRDGNFSPPADPNDPNAQFKAGDVILSQDLVTLPYLPDPVAKGASLTFFDRKRKQIGSVRLVDFYSGGATWPNPVSFRLRLVEGTGEPKWEQDGPRVLTVYVPKAERVIMRYSCTLPSDLLEQQAIWKWVEDRNPSNLSDLRNTALQGRHWMLTPFREAIFVHPVQQPLEEPKIEKLSPTKGLGETFAQLNGRVTLHGLSTARVDLEAEWQEPVDDLTLPEPTTINGKGHVLDAAPGEDHVAMTLGNPETPTQQPGAAPAGEVNLMLFPVTPMKMVRPGQVLAPGVQHVVAPGAQQVAAPGVLQAQTAQKQALTASFAKFEIQGPDMPMGTSFAHFRAEKGILQLVPPTLDLGSRKHEFGDTRYRKVHYTAIATTRFREHFLDLLFPPSSDTSKTLPGETVIPLTRQGSVDAIVLNSARPAVPKSQYVLPTFSWERKEDEATVISRRCCGGLRVYLERPWYSSGDGELLGVTLNAAGSFVDEGDPLRAYVTQWGLDPIWKSSGTIKNAPTLSDFTLATQKSTNVILDEIASKVVHVAGHEVVYEKERKLWFTDIGLDGGTAYFPFVRLALVRFQPNSIAKAHISRVVLTDFIQIVPDRTAAVTVNSEKKVTVQVAGVFGLREPQELSTPVQLRSHQFFTAVLEKKTGAGSFDWAPVKPETPAQQMMTAVVNPDLMTPMKQYGAKMVWAKEITVPDPVLKRGTGAYRVVIKEYEVYQTSNTETGTRLVYADAIEF